MTAAYADLIKKNRQIFLRISQYEFIGLLEMIKHRLNVQNTLSFTRNIFYSKYL